MSEAAASVLRPGTVVGRYRIEHLLGAGASGSVYVAHCLGELELAELELAAGRQAAAAGAASDVRAAVERPPPVGRRVAFKLLHRHLVKNYQISKRFKREARILERLEGEHLVPILDAGEAGGQLYMALELVEGKALDELMRETEPSLEDAVRILREVCLALEVAHGSGVVHRDLKPSNILLEPVTTNSEEQAQLGGSPNQGGDGHASHSRGGSDRQSRDARVSDSQASGQRTSASQFESGRVRVLDFGMAKLIHGSASTSMTALTEQNMVFGTPEYMAPEQARGDEVDARSDIYSAGVLLYELVSGRLPFRGNTPIGIMTAHLVEEPVPPSSQAPHRQIPPAVEAVVLHAMAKQPERRYPSARHLREALAVAMLSPWDTDSTAPPGADDPALTDTQHAMPMPAGLRQPDQDVGAVSLDAATSEAGSSRLWLVVAVAAAIVGIAAGVLVSLGTR